MEPQPPPISPGAAVEDQIQQQLLTDTKERTFIDKLLAREDINKVQQLIKKEKLTRQDLQELQYLISQSESKLYNFSSWERYVMLKFYVWIREFVQVAMMNYEYEDDQLQRERKGEYGITKNAKNLMRHNERLLEHNVKFMIDLYLNICRTSLSLGATGFLEILKNKYEIDYRYPGMPQQATNDGKIAARGGT